MVVRMLLVVVIVFITLWLPYRGLLVYNSFATLLNKKKFMDLWFLMFAKTCIYINSAIKPILYNVMSGKFRRAFHKLLRCPRTAAIGNSGSVTASTTSGIFSSLRKSLKKSTPEEPDLKTDPGSSNDMNISSFKEPVQEDSYGQTEL
ncbi:thyrotropin-releasing hormone receptor-like [Anabrus simplex]|uniref:thyrotropin-releasing hormone receptor-like n=1 Tax=Anabrus simplex TaxID=316456 RepID=UPI0035A2CEB4